MKPQRYTRTREWRAHTSRNFGQVSASPHGDHEAASSFLARKSKGWHRPLVLAGACALGVFSSLAAESAKPPPSPPVAPAASDAEILLKLLQDKGLISAQDVDQARAELARRVASEPPRESKLKVADWIKTLQLYGDARLRFEYREGENGAISGEDHMERDRWRYRVRVGANLQFTDQFRAGLRLETGPGGRSSNVTFGDDAGPWGKESDRIHLGLLFLSWEPRPWLSATAGRQEIPFKTTSLVWDHDLTPEGLSETFKHQWGRVELFAIFGQFVYDDANPDNPFGAGGVSDAFLFAQQLGARANLGKDISVQVAPLFHVYSGTGDSFRGPFIGTAPANTPGLNDLAVLEVPSEVRFKLGRLPARVFGDFAVNLEGAERARAAGASAYKDEIYAWQAGVELGSAKKRGGWSVKAFYQMSDLFALDPNLVDSDVFDSRLNMEGFVLQGVYALTDFANFTLTYANADRNHKALPTGAVGDLGGSSGTAFLEHYQLLQADLSFKF